MKSDRDQERLETVTSLIENLLTKIETAREKLKKELIEKLNKSNEI
jgi:hypothetical protein